jgi:inner membrane protein
MSGSNHVVGGIVFTGIFASFWNVNIFEKPEYLFFTAFFAILPDIDHLKSPIGKMFYPIAKWLNLKYGHRTITHSLIFYFSLFLIIGFLEKTFFVGHNITLIYGFAFFSHLLFDMLTKQGIPLFWPFMRNPCVIPGNPDLRLKSSHLQTEAVIFGIFILLGITCQPLFSQGFWTSYNKVFNDLKHLNQEARMNENVLNVKYEFISDGKKKSGEGILISSTDNNAIILSSNNFVEIKSENRITNLLPTKTTKKLVKEDLLFFNITTDSLNRLLRNKPLLQMKLQSTTPFSYIKENKPQTGTSADLEFTYNPVISFLPDSLTNNLANKMEILNYELQKTISAKSLSEESRRSLVDRINQLAVSINKMDLYEREKAVPQLAKLKTELENFNAAEDQSGKLRIQITQLKKEIETKRKITLSGYIQYLNQTNYN